ncbi:MAG: LamG domain-containing protein [Cytophagales bacterium]|nr:MAG: LamG domain-containing protein [Cytophagales bacterium]
MYIDVFLVYQQTLLKCDLTNVLGPSSGVNIIDGNWHHVLINITNNSFQLNLDGEKTGTNLIMNPDIYCESIEIGNHISSVFNNPFIGLIDEVRIYNRALTDCEIKKLYDCNSTCSLLP